MSSITNEIYIGPLNNPLFHFNNDEITSVNATIEVSISGEQLSTDTIEVVVDYEYLARELFKPSNYDAFKDVNGVFFTGKSTAALTSLIYGTEINWYCNGTSRASFYVSSVKRIGKKSYQINGISYIGILERQKSLGGLYQGITFRNVLADILNPTIPIRQQREKVVSAISDDNSKYLLNALTDVGHKNTLTITANVEFPLSLSLKTMRFASWTDGTNSYCFNITASEYHNYISWIYNINDNFVQMGQINEDLTSISVSFIDSKIKLNNQEWTLSQLPGVSSSPYPLCIFKNEFGPVSTSNVKIYDGSTLIRDYIPVNSVLSEKAELYDTITKTSITDLSGYYSVKTYYPSTGGNIVNRNESGFVGYQIPLPSYPAISFDTGVENILINGWLPFASKKNNIYQLMLANNINLIKGADGSWLFTWLYNSQSTPISDDDIFIEGSNDYFAKANKIAVTEHSFLDNESATDVTLFDNTSGEVASNQLVAFESAPIIVSTLTASSGLTILKANCNCAYVSGTGTLTGKPYDHATVIKSEDIVSDAEDSEVSITDAYLVNTLNSENVLKRLKAYFTAGAYKINNDIVWNGQRCGSFFSFTDPFGDKATAFLSKIALTASKITRATSVFVANYLPPKGGNNYSNVVILNKQTYQESGGVWNVPSEVISAGSSIRIIVIGGGDGGSSGCAGENGQNGADHFEYNLTSAQAGEKGTAGSGGRVYQVTVQNPSSSYNYVIGNGGNGGAKCTNHSTANPGDTDTAAQVSSISDGTHTYSSANGSITTGIYNFLTGEKYATSGSDSGINGGNAQVPYQSSSYSYIFDHPSSVVSILYKGISYISGHSGEGIEAWSMNYYAGNSMGGGPAAGQSGSNGSAAEIVSDTIFTGVGGNGADASDQEAETIYGKGGSSGHGGGAGGQGGAVGNISAEGKTIYAQQGGTGGKGGKGGNGGPGCIMIYY